MAWDIKSAADYDNALRNIQKKLDNVFKNVKTASVQAITDIAIDCLGRSVDRAPVENGDLRGSGFAEVNQATIAMGKDDKSGGIDLLGSPGEVSGDEIEAAIGFTAPYAFVQHEHTEFNHPMGGQAKYLESVIKERSPAWKKHLTESAKNGAEDGGV